MASKARIDIEARDKASQIFDKVQRSMGDLDKRAAALSTGFAGITKAFGLGSVAGIGLATALASSVRTTAQYQDAMGKAAQRAGVTAEAISALSYAAELSDVSLQELQKGLQLIGQDAANGGKKLSEFGIAVRNLDGSLKTNDQLLREFADRIAGMETPSQRSAAAVKLLGEEGAKLVPLLSGGSTGIKTMTDEAERFGRVVSTEAAEAAAKFNDNLTRLQNRIQGLLQTMATPAIARINAFWSALERGADRGRVAGLASDVIRLQKDLEALESRRTNPFINQKVLEENISQTRAKFEEAKRIFNEAYATFSGTAPEQPALPPIPEEPKGNGNGNGNGGGNNPKVSAAQRYLEQLQRQMEALDELTVKETLLRDIGMGRLQGMTAAQQRDLMGIAEAIDLRRQGAIDEAAAEAERKAIIDARRQANIDEHESILARNEAHQQFIETLLSNTPTGRLEEQRRVMQLLADEFERGALSAEQFSEAAQTFLGNTASDIDRTRSITEELGLTFTSAFEDAIAQGRNLGEVLQGLEQDIIRIITRKLVTEPLGNFITGAIGSIIPGLKSFDGGGYTGPGSRIGGLDGKGGYLAMLHPNETVLDHTRGQRMPPSSVQNINITVPMPSNGRRETALQFGRDVARSLQTASMRNG